LVMFAVMTAWIALASSDHLPWWASLSILWAWLVVFLSTITMASALVTALLLRDAVEMHAQSVPTERA
jgi:hypothetical protein